MRQVRFLGVSTGCHSQNVRDAQPRVFPVGSGPQSWLAPRGNA